MDNAWYEERRKRLTCSNFGEVMKRRPTTKAKVVVEKLLYSKFKGNAYTRIGLQKEQTTITEYVHARQNQGVTCKVIPSGLVVDEECQYLAGSPDGIVVEGSEKGVIEIKNLLYDKPVNFTEAVTNKEISQNFCLHLKDGNMCLKRNHNYYYQRQGLVNICKLPWIDFVVRTDNPYDLFIERIVKDDQLWVTMVEKLSAFYLTVLLPELASPRHNKSPGIREPGVWFPAESGRKLKLGKRSAVDTSSDGGTRTTETEHPSSSNAPSTSSSITPAVQFPAESGRKSKLGKRSAADTSSDGGTRTTEPEHPSSSNAPSTLSSTTPKPAKRKRKIKCVGRTITHQWIVDDKGPAPATQWFNGIVLSLLRGTDGTNDAVYEMQYDGEEDVLEVDHLVRDFAQSQVKFIDA